MSLTATATPLLTTAQGAPSRVASPQEIRRNLPQMELLAKDIEQLSKEINRLKSILASLSPTITISGQSTFTMDITGISGSSIINVVDGQVTGFTP